MGNQCDLQHSQPANALWSYMGYDIRLIMRGNESPEQLSHRGLQFLPDYLRISSELDWPLSLYLLFSP